MTKHLAMKGNVLQSQMTFFSKTEKARYISLFHRRQDTPNTTKSDKTFYCNYENCTEKFGSSVALSQHGMKENHRTSDKKQSSGKLNDKQNQKTKKRPHRKMNLTEFQRQRKRNGFYAACVIFGTKTKSDYICENCKTALVEVDFYMDSDDE